MRGIGIDIVEVKRMAQKCQKLSFVKMVFTSEEETYCLAQGNSDQCFAARFAAKEAYMKAVGLGWTSDAQFHEIELYKLESGQPKLRLHGNTKKAFEKEGFSDMLLTISHTSQTAVAVVIVI
ncbi:holo-[acyl-carrier protein] synthase [Algoriphagus sp. 4150]|uniref:holo-ACP synthase n=1 Tax=Algoriphagus sp. 4150 TaxID=2817756 RepID=UPI0028556075|nr:holo-ACP synthase [Algoriphagus sp. 4150]MDR7129153.1 holo-[acyl-carrier protein] synthase [Algoriphagus sp. 4150]